MASRTASFTIGLRIDTSASDNELFESLIPQTSRYRPFLDHATARKDQCHFVDTAQLPRRLTAQVVFPGHSSVFLRLKFGKHSTRAKKPLNLNVLARRR